MLSIGQLFSPNLDGNARVKVGIFLSLDLILCRRGANLAAHILAKNTSPSVRGCTWLNQVPDFLV